MDVLCKKSTTPSTRSEIPGTFANEVGKKRPKKLAEVETSGEDRRNSVEFVGPCFVPIGRNSIRITKKSSQETQSRFVRIVPRLPSRAEFGMSSVRSSSSGAASLLPISHHCTSPNDCTPSTTPKSSPRQRKEIKRVSSKNAESPKNARASEKKRALELMELKLDDYQVVEIDRQIRPFQEGQDQYTIKLDSIRANPHKKLRYLLNLPDPHHISNRVKKSEKPNPLDPCPVIAKLGNAKLGNQLYIAQNWESRPGVCDPRVSKLCSTTSENFIKNYLRTGQATIGAKVFLCDGHNNTKAEGWIANNGILCSRCGFVLGCREFRTCSGLKSHQSGCHFILSSGVPLRAQNCKLQTPNFLNE